jgi:hypothetical protein
MAINFWGARVVRSNSPHRALGAVAKINGKERLLTLPQIALAEQLAKAGPAGIKPKREDTSFDVEALRRAGLPVIHDRISNVFTMDAAAPQRVAFLIPAAAASDAGRPMAWR